MIGEDEVSTSSTNETPPSSRLPCHPGCPVIPANAGISALSGTARRPRIKSGMTGVSGRWITSGMTVPGSAPRGQDSGLARRSFRLTGRTSCRRGTPINPAERWRIRPNHACQVDRASAARPRGDADPGGDRHLGCGVGRLPGEQTSTCTTPASGSPTTPSSPTAGSTNPRSAWTPSSTCPGPRAHPS